jgi:hypothetical protein
MRFMSGITPARRLVERMADAPPLVVMADAGVLAQPAFAAWLGTAYERMRKVDDPSYEDVFLYKRRGT